MLETGIPKSLWRGDKMKEKLVGQFDKEKDKFMNKPDTKFQPSLDQKLPETKKFAYAKQVSDFGLNDMISDKKFRFENVNNNILLGEQLPDDRPFKFSLGIKGINDHFDSMAPNKDYRYTDPQFYEYKLKDMTQQKIAETNWRVQGDTITNPDDLDGYARAIAYAQEYRRSKEAKSSPPSVQSSPERNTINAAAGGGGIARKPNTNLMQALEEAKLDSKPSSRVSSRRNSGEIDDMTGSNVVNQMENLEKGGIVIEPPKRTSKDIFQNIKNRKDTAKKNIKFLAEKAKDIGENSLERKRTNTARNQSIGLQKASKLVNDKQQLRSGFQQLKEQIQKHKEQLPNYKKSESVSTPTAQKTNIHPPNPPEKTNPHPDPKPDAKKSVPLTLFSSTTAQSLTPAQKLHNITKALSDFKADFEKGGSSQIGATDAKKFSKYDITINGNSHWNTAKTLLIAQAEKLGGKKNEIEEIFAPVLKGKAKQSLSFDDKTKGGFGFEPPTPEQSRASSKVSDATKKTGKN